MDVGVIDVNTCEPLPDVLVDLWHANTTGHYAGTFRSVPLTESMGTLIEILRTF